MEVNVLKQVQSYADTAVDLDVDVEVPQPLLVGGLQTVTTHEAKRVHVDSKILANCCIHDYTDDWRCRKCGYTLTKHLRARIDRIIRSVNN